MQIYNQYANTHKQWRLQKFGTGGGKVRGEVKKVPPPQNLSKFLCKNGAFCAKFSLLLRCI